MEIISILEFTGINSVYEEPWRPEITLDTEKLSIEQSVAEIIKYLDDHVNKKTRNFFTCLKFRINFNH